MTCSALAQPPPGLTDDAILRGALRLWQPARGYRFNLDALLLAHFAAATHPVPPTLLIDLGAGCGVVGLLLARRWPRCRARLVERQAGLARLAERNLARNGLAGRVRVRAGDLRRVALWRPRAAVRRALVVCNPPFFPLTSGRCSPEREVAEAKHELTCTLAELIAAAARGLRCGDGLALIHLVARQAELLRALHEQGFALQRVRAVLPLPGRAATRLLVLARRGAGCAVGGKGGPRSFADALEGVDPPLVVHCAPGVYSAELRQLLGDEPTVPPGPSGARRL